MHTMNLFNCAIFGKIYIYIISILSIYISTSLCFIIGSSCRRHPWPINKIGVIVKIIKSIRKIDVFYEHDRFRRSKVNFAGPLCVSQVSFYRARHLHAHNVIVLFTVSVRETIYSSRAFRHSVCSDSSHK